MNLYFRKEEKQTIKITVKDYEENRAKLGAGDVVLPGRSTAIGCPVLNAHTSNIIWTQ